MNKQPTKASPSLTMSNIERKRRIRRMKQRLRVLRLVVFCLVVGIFLAFISLVCYGGYRLVSSVYGDYQSMHQGYEQRQQQNCGAIDPAYDGYTNILVLGLDDGVNAEGAAGQRADAILLVSLDNTSGQVRFVSIPRDTLVQLPGQNKAARINTAYTAGGAPLAVRTADNLLGISIHQYVTIDMAALREIVDVLGGIDIYVEANMDYDDKEAGLSIHIPKGYQHLDGEKAQEYLRYKNTELGDVGRMHRQQHFLKALHEKLVQPAALMKVPQLAEIFKQRIGTSAEIFDTGHLAHFLKSLAANDFQMRILPGYMSEGYWLPDKKKIQKEMAELFPATIVDDTDMNTEE
jgi:LCP family protein required for cell wall assembly